MELPLYDCHKQVRAAKITDIRGEADGSHVLALAVVIDGGSDKPIEQSVPAEWIKKNSPSIGGYFVVYANDYTSYSPADAFEEGYTLTAGAPVPTTREALSDAEKDRRAVLVGQVLAGKGNALLTAEAVIKQAGAFENWINGGANGN